MGWLSRGFSIPEQASGHGQKPLDICAWVHDACYGVDLASILSEPRKIVEHNILRYGSPYKVDDEGSESARAVVLEHIVHCRQFLARWSHRRMRSEKTLQKSPRNK
jgi:hypothetical protein